MLNLNIDLLRKALNEIEENSYQNLCLLENATANPAATYRYGGFTSASHRFSRDFNRNGDFVAFDRSERFLKFSFPININSPEDRAERQKERSAEKPLTTLALRGKQNRPTVEAYVNGLKIPDQRVVMTMFESGIDVYIPEVYFQDEQNEVGLLINKYTAMDRYMQFYVRDRMQQQFVFTNEDSRIQLDKQNLKVFRNGWKLMEGVHYTMRIEGQKLYVDLSEILDKHETLEVANSSHCIHKADYRSKADAMLDFPEGILKELPVSPDILEVYKNGKRLFPHEIQVLTARHAKIKDFSRGDEVTVRVHYNEFSTAILDRNSYIDDLLRYFALKDRDQIRDILLNGKYEDVPDFVRDRVFPPGYIPIRNVNPSRDGMTYDEFVVHAIKEYIKINSQNMRYLLKWFSGIGDKVFQYPDKDRYERDDTTKEMGDFNKTVFDNKKVVYSMRLGEGDFELLVFINDVKVLQRDVMQFDYMGNTHVYIDSHRLKDNDLVRFKLVKVRNRVYKKVFITDDGKSPHFLVSRESLGDIGKLSDVRVMRQRGTGFAFMTGGVDFLITEEPSNPKMIRVLVASRREGAVYCVYNSSFFEYRTSHFEGEDVRSRSAFPLDVRDPASGIFLPRLSNYGNFLFVDGEMLIEGLDYFVSGQNRHADIDVAQVIFRKIPRHMSEMEFYSVEQERAVLAAIEDIDSVLGLIYLKDLPIPFSLDYLDLYVNNRKMTEDDIVIISDKLIQVVNPDIKRPFFNVYVTTNLAIAIGDLDEFKDVYEQNPPKFDEWLEDEIIPDDKLDETIGQKDPDKPPHPEEPTPRPPIPRISPFLNLLALRLYSGAVPRLMDANVYTSIFRAIEFVELMTEAELHSLQVELNANKYQTMNDATLDAQQPRLLDPDGEEVHHLDPHYVVYRSDKFTQYRTSHIDGSIALTGVYVNGELHEGPAAAVLSKGVLTVKMHLTESDRVSLVGRVTHAPRFHQVAEIVERYLRDNPELDFDDLFRNFDSLPISQRLYREELGNADANRGGDGGVVIFNANL